MFTGIVEELGTVVAITPVGGAPGDSARLTIHGPTVTSDAAHGDSISVNGVCLTVTETGDGRFGADVMKETLDRSGLGSLSPGSPVNLERAAKVSDRLGGHIVQGHVDGTGVITERVPGTGWETVRVSVPPGLSRYVVEKGSVTVDGVSLTVVEAGPDFLTVSLIPTTMELTTLGAKGVGAVVNLEVDIVAKYVERLLGDRTGGAR
ncbi:riboflavin synthase [Actinorugispora endophytica]|uniref:Riboflavin synthase n=1 Tax=Actinorugispora endophytica TaxID=1605990 RepID=A0A4R6V290_9ACTN|nr:riboflavin synthase [Actinorugispora endophytica]TDQ52565.1 riboflavin synthase alpha chain [Actinorugispora endophytica]